MKFDNLCSDQVLELVFVWVLAVISKSFVTELHNIRYFRFPIQERLEQWQMLLCICDAVSIELIEENADLEAAVVVRKYDGGNSETRQLREGRLYFVWLLNHSC